MNSSDYIVTTRKKLPRNKYGDIYSTASESTIISGGGSSGGSSGGGSVYSNFTPATEEAAGRAGLVPGPQQGSNLTTTYLLNAQGQFVNFEVLSHLLFDNASVYPSANQSYNLGKSSNFFNTAYLVRWQPTSDSTKYIEYDSTNGAFKVNGSIYATGNVAAGGFSNTSGSGTGGGGSDIDVYTASSLSTNASAFSSSSTSNTFNAYTINYLHRRLNSIESGNVNINMNDYVKKTELSQQSYITSSSLNTTLGDYVTKTLLSQQSYVTASQLSNQSYVTATQLSNQSYVTNTALGNTLSSYVTKTQLSAQSYLVKTGDTMTGNLTIASGKKIIFNSSPASYIQYDSSNGALMVYGSIYATGNVAAGGYSGTSGGSSGGDTNITITNGAAESGKYISGLSASGSTITVTKATLPSGGTSSGDYLPISGGTLTGDLRLKDSGNYGRKINFGDGNYAYIIEDTDDHLTIYGDKGVTIACGSNGSISIPGFSGGNSGTTGNYLPLTGGTLTGNLRLKDSGNYGMKLNFGDGEYAYIIENTDDHLTIYADKGITLATGANGTVEIPGLEASGGNEWYNIKTEKIKDTSTNKWTLHTIIENYAGSALEKECTSGSAPKYVSGTKYRIVLMTFRRHQNTGRGWRVPMFSRYWDWSTDALKQQTQEHVVTNTEHRQDIMWQKTWWTVTTNDTIWFWNRYKWTSSASAPKLLKSENSSNFVINDSYSGTGAGIDSTNHRWRGVKNKKRRVGVAIFKYTGTGTFGWQRVSNIAYVELFVNTKNEVQTNVIE